MTLEEFERMIQIVPRVLAGEGRWPKGKTRNLDAQSKAKREVDSAAVASWRFFLEGLWWGGLRLGEALNLYWNRADRLQVDLSGKRPMIRIPAELEKGNQERLSPMAPEFFRLLETVPQESRKGRVFKLIGASGKTTPMGLEHISEMISRVGRLAGVKVHIHPRTGKVKYASAHDLRRSFCERWAMKVMPQVLMEMARHADIATTQRYYISRNARNTAEALWAAYDQAQPQPQPGGRPSGQGCGYSEAKTTIDSAPPNDAIPCETMAYAKLGSKDLNPG
ncbi:MAG: site-specific integrase [Planctomycetes bacterium]|nr:site-specific integrase [Planctomycetota bacterium]MCG2682473.1 site-specific integrase [Planctomycetales bacterium]